MSEEEKKEEKKTFDYSNLIAVPIVLVVLGPMAVGLWEEEGQHVYGSTPQEIAAVSLVATPKQLGHALPNTSVTDTRVVVRFKTSAGKPYEKATFTWDKSDLSAPHGMELEASREHEDDEEMPAALERRFHGAHHGSFSWGPVSFSASGSHGRVSFSINGTHKGNPQFDKQVDAARQVLLSMAFGIAPALSDREIADVLGSGYPTGDVAKLDVGVTIEDAGDAVRKLFPGARSDRRDTFEVAIDHPLFQSVHFGWQNVPRGRLMNLSLQTTDAYKASRGLLATCLTQKLGAPREKVVDYAADVRELTFTVGKLTLTLNRGDVSLSGWPVEAASFAQLFAALDACRDAHETGSTARSEKK